MNVRVKQHPTVRKLRGVVVGVIGFSVCWMHGVVVYAAPVDGDVVGGSAAISQSGNPGNIRTEIQQNSPRAVIDWRGFNTDAGENTTFIQPSQDAVILNRVRSTDPTR